jgi:DNA anti-recombination protein RmuC
VDTATQERTSRAFEHTAPPNGDAAALSIGISQRVIGPLAELSMVAVQGNARLATELSILALEAIQESHSAALRRLSAWPDALTDPLHLCHRGCRDALDSAQRALLLMATTARLVTQSAERMQTAATDAGRRVREALEGSTGLPESARR